MSTIEIPSTAPSPIDFLATEIAETSRLTRELTAAAGNAIAALAERTANGHERQALHRLMVALQAQDRVEQRLMRLEAFARSLGRGTASDIASATLREALQLDELVTAFEHHMNQKPGVDSARPELSDQRSIGDGIEMF